MRGDWPLVSLRHALRHRSEFITIEDWIQYKRCRVQLHARGVVLRDEVFGAEIKTKRQQVCRSGELLVAEIDAKVGGYGIVPEELHGAVVSSHYFLFEIDESVLNESFLGYLIQTPHFAEQIRAQGSTNYASIRPGDVLNYLIPLPPLPMQQRIVERIDRVSKNIGAIQRLRTETRILSISAHTRSTTKLVQAKLSRFPLVHLGELVDVRGGGTPAKWNPEFWSGSIPWVTPKDMKKPEIWDSIDHISEEATQRSPAALLEAGSVLIVVRGMILAHTVPVAVLRVLGSVNQDMKALIPKAGISADYLAAVLRANSGQLLQLVTKSTHDTRKLETAKLLQLEIPVASPQEQRKVVEALGRLDRTADELYQHQQRVGAGLDALLPAILDRAFRGEL